jgi:hypothetical protein
MKVIEDGTERPWTQELICGSCKSKILVEQDDLRLFRKKYWESGHLGARCGACQAVILFGGDLLADRSGWIPAGCPYPPEYVYRKVATIEAFGE